MTSDDSIRHSLKSVFAASIACYALVVLNFILLLVYEGIKAEAIFLNMPTLVCLVLVLFSGVTFRALWPTAPIAAYIGILGLLTISILQDNYTVVALPGIILLLVIVRGHKHLNALRRIMQSH